MRTQSLLSFAAACVAVQASVTRQTTRGGYLAKRQQVYDDGDVDTAPGMAGMEDMAHRDARTLMPWWNFVNDTTPDATLDGIRGVLLEPDLIPGRRGKDGGQIRKIRIGPYDVEAGSNLEVPVPDFQHPCSDCYITAIQLGLEYPNGQVANVDTGAWCHHIDLTVPGEDYTCPSSLLNTVTTFADPAMGGRRIFSTGNERVPMRLNSRRKYGLDLESGRFGGVMEFMNENKRAIQLYMTLTFEFVPKSTPGYREAQMMWVDVTNCGRQSDFAAPTGTYRLSSQNFQVKEDSYWLNAIGHEHDGGTHVELYVNDRLSCLSKQLYGNRRGGWIEPVDGSIVESMVMPPYSHISDVGVCKDWGEVKAGDNVRVVAYYNDTMHMQMLDAAGKLEPQMGIMFTWLGPKGDDGPPMQSAEQEGEQ